MMVPEPADLIPVFSRSGRIEERFVSESSGQFKLHTAALTTTVSDVARGGTLYSRVFVVAGLKALLQQT
jgi:hypothetical protein